MNDKISQFFTKGALTVSCLTWKDQPDSIIYLDNIVSKAQVEVDEFIANHKRRVEAKGVKDLGTKKVVSLKHRYTSCYSCALPLDSYRDLECSACGWIICTCATCGCGYIKDFL